jgi:hypothetical protein
MQFMSSADKRGSIAIILVIIVLVLVVAGGGFFYYTMNLRQNAGPPTQTPYTISQTIPSNVSPLPVATPVSTEAPAASLPPTSNSDIKTLDSKLNALGGDQTNIDAGLNQTAPSVE